MEDFLSTSKFSALSPILGDILMSDRIMRDMHYLCDVVGQRPSGSEGEVQARDYLLERFQNIGLERVLAEPFTAPHWLRGKTSCKIVEPINRSIELLALPMNETHKVRAEAVWAPYTTKSELGALDIDLKGKICVTPAITVTGKNVRQRKQRVQIAYEAGAVGLIWVSHLPGNLLPTGSHDVAIAKEMPAFGASYEDGHLLERLINSHGPVTLEIETNNSTAYGTSWNVSGELVRGGPGAETVMLTAHLDSHDITDGAFDNASGCALVLSCAEAMVKYLPTTVCNIRFVIFSGEEVGLVGSSSYVEEHKEVLPCLRFLLNADGLGVMPTTKYIHVPLYADLVSYIHSTYRKFGFEVAVENIANMNWDHAAFAKQGIPVGSLTSKWAPGTSVHYGHTKADTLEKIDAQDMRYAACCAALLTAVVATDDDWPIVRLGKDELEAALQKAGVLS